MIGSTLTLDDHESVLMTSNKNPSGLSSVAEQSIRLKTIRDLALIQAVQRALRSTGYLELRNLDIRISDESVEIFGRVRTYHLKQLAQSAATRVSGIARVVNAVEVINGR
jgi:osmotically-inducible protein OsmY